MSERSDQFVGEGSSGGGPLTHGRPKPDGAPVRDQRAPAPSAPSDDPVASGPNGRKLARRRSQPSSLRSMPTPTLFLFLLPALGLYCLFVLYPLAQSARYSLYDWNGLEPLTNFVGFGNFREAFTDPKFWAALRHNAIIVALSLVVQLPFALAMAVLLNQRLKGRALLRVMFFAPFVLSEVVTAVVWRQILRPAGMFDQVLTAIGAEGVIQEWLANPDVQLYSVFAVVSWKYFGFHMILMLAGLQQIPDEMSEAAAIDGATSWQSFRHVTFPLLGPSIRVSVFLSVIGALQLFDLVWVLFGGPSPLGASSTMATYLYQEFNSRNLGYASALSIVIFALSLVVALLYQRFALNRDLQGGGARA